jgi:hypothetical protein
VLLPFRVVFVSRDVRWIINSKNKEKEEKDLFFEEKARPEKKAKAFLKMVRRAIIAQQLVCASLRFGVMVRNYLALNYFANHKRSGRASEVVSSQLSFFFFP